jgi:alpha-ketoglutarate-dependent taurine dioxygenase
LTVQEEDDMQDLKRAGVAVVSPHLTPRWDAEAFDILDTLASHHRHVADYQAITGLGSEQATALLKDDLRSAAPSLGDFVDHLMASVEASGVAAYVPSLGLGGFEAERRARLLYALTVCIGEPSPTDAKSGRILWDVAPRRTSGDYFATFSEHDGEAAFHTDTQYYPAPERWVALYVMTPASCGGGQSVLCDGAAVRAALDTPATRWALRALEDRPLPFRVPSVFATDPRPGVVQATLAPVFSSCPGVRYRRDTLLDGWTHFPEHHDAEAEDAVRALERALVDSQSVVRFRMERDSLLIVDNHRALHARTAFSDQKRHLLRVRMRGDERREALNVPTLSKLRSRELGMGE